MYIWSWTFLILPVAAVIAGIGAFFAIKAIAKRIKRKAAAQKAAKQAQGKEKTNEKQQEKTPEKTTEALVTKQQTAPVAQQQVKKQTTDIVATKSDAEYIKQLGTFPYDLKNHEMVKNNRNEVKQLLDAWRDYNTAPSKELRAKAQISGQELWQYLHKDHNEDFIVSPALLNRAGNYVAQVDGEKDWRNYCFDGNGAPNFKKACEESYSVQDGYTMPTIFQVDSEGRDPFIVSATHPNLFKAGVMDIETTMKAQNIDQCTFRLVSHKNQNILITKQGTIKDIDKFMQDNNIFDTTQEDNLSK